MREALATLEQEGLISVRPQRGSFVFQPTREDTENLCEFRAVIEAEALRLAIRSKRDETIAEMRQAAEDMSQAMADGLVPRVRATSSISVETRASPACAEPVAIARKRIT